MRADLFALATIWNYWKTFGLSNNSNNSKRADQVEIEKISGQARVETAHPYGVAQNTKNTAIHIAEAQLATLNFQDPIFQDFKIPPYYAGSFLNLQVQDQS